MAASRRAATIDFAGQGLADQQHASGESSATPAGRAGNVGARVAGISPHAGQSDCEAARRHYSSRISSAISIIRFGISITRSLPTLAKKMALIGESRVADILANVLFPFWLAEDDSTFGTEYAKLPARLSNRRLETAATRLFGNDPRRKQFLKTVAHQQGLLQIYEDFCMQDNSDCAQCPFPEQMAKWT